MVCRHQDLLVLYLKASRQTRSVFSDLIICRQGAIKQPALLDLGDISNKSLVPSLEDLVEDNPVRLPVLLIVSKTFNELQAKVDLQT